MSNAMWCQKRAQDEGSLTRKGERMQLGKYTLPVIVSVMLWCVATVPLVEAQPRRPPQALLKLVRVEPVGQDVLLAFRVPEALDLGCPMQLRIGDFSVSFREIQDQKARTARFVISRDLYAAIDNRQFNTVLTSCFNWVSSSITYPRLASASPPPAPQAALKLVRAEPAGQDVLLVFRVPEGLDLGCPMQLRIGDFSVNFRDVQDQKARTARFVMSRDVYAAIDNRQFNTVLTSCAGRVEHSITYPPLGRARQVVR
jgi:hypothetical protein